MRNAKGEGSMWRTDDGSWRGYVTVNGRRRYFSDPTKTGAAKKRRELLNLRDATGLTTGRSISVGKWIEHWLDVTEHKESTDHRYRQILKHNIPEHFKRTPITRVSAEQIEDLYTSLKAAYSDSTRHQVHTLIHASLKLAYQRGKIAHNPADLIVNKPPKGRRRTEVLSQADILVLEATLEHSWSRARWMLALGLGLRPSEVRGLEWADIDYKAKTIHVHQQVQQIDGKFILVPTAKTDAGNRVIPLPDYLADIMREHYTRSMQWLGAAKMWSPDKKPHSWCFTSKVKRGRPLTDSGDRKQWQRILDRAGLPHVRPYVARHTAASVLFAHGVDAATVAAILGHTDSSFTLRTYVHSLEESKKAAADTLELIFQDKVQNRVQRKNGPQPNEAVGR